MTESQAQDQRKVLFSIKAESGSEIYVAGSFNGWDSKANKLVYADGNYWTTVLLRPGKHEYKFSINGVWCIDPQCPEFTPNGVGGLNSVMLVE